MSASEKKLNALHDKVVDFLSDRLDSEDVTAADVGNVIKLLKDNSITCSVSEGTKVAELEAKLAQRRAKRARPTLTAEDIADAGAFIN